MKKLISLLAILAIPFLLHAQGTLKADLSIADVKGKVRSCVLSRYGGGEEYIFTPKGQLASVYGQNIGNYFDRGIKRNPANRISEGKMYDDMLNGVVTYVYKYDGNGRLTVKEIKNKYSTIKYIYTYNNKGDRTSEKIIGQETGDVYTSYTITKRDSHGNWIMRTCKPQGGTSYVETRKITYYKSTDEGMPLNPEAYSNPGARSM